VYLEAAGVYIDDNELQGLIMMYLPPGHTRPASALMIRIPTTS
jgi:hypothetical protein